LLAQAAVLGSARQPEPVPQLAPAHTPPRGPPLTEPVAAAERPFKAFVPMVRDNSLPKGPRELRKLAAT